MLAHAFGKKGWKTHVEWIFIVRMQTQAFLYFLNIKTVRISTMEIFFTLQEILN